MFHLSWSLGGSTSRMVERVQLVLVNRCYLLLFCRKCALLYLRMHMETSHMMNTPCWNLENGALSVPGLDLPDDELVHYTFLLYLARHKVVEVPV